MEALTGLLDAINKNPELVRSLSDLAIFALPIIIGYLGSKYVTGTASESKVKALMSATVMAVDRVESMDQEGFFRGFDGDEKGEEKRKQAYRVIRESLKRSGWTLKDDAQTNQVLEDALNAQLHERYGIVLPVRRYSEVAAESLESVLRLQSQGQLRPPPGTDPQAYLLAMVASRIVATLAREKLAITPENANAWAHDAWITHEQSVAQPLGAVLAPEASLAELTHAAAQHVARLREAGPLDLQLAEDGADQDRVIVLAWLITETAQRRLPVSISEIRAAADAALAEARAAARAPAA